MEEYITNDDYVAQEKKDGERRIAQSGIKILGVNKKGTEVPLPDSIINSIKIVYQNNNVVGGETIVDGEIIGEKLFVFDLLSTEEIRNLSYERRLIRLSLLTFGNHIEVVETAFTTAEKRAMFERLKAENKEGIVFKRKDAPYSAGRPNSGGNQLKFKFYKTATFIVANITKNKRSVGLHLILDADRVFMGKVTIPPNYDVPEIGELIEVRYLYAYRGGAVFQPTYLGKRPDSDLTDCTMAQMIYKENT